MAMGSRFHNVVIRCQEPVESRSLGRFEECAIGELIPAARSAVVKKDQHPALTEAGRLV